VVTRLCAPRKTNTAKGFSQSTQSYVKTHQ
jgi:hypothetical protein